VTHFIKTIAFDLWHRIPNVFDDMNRRDPRSQHNKEQQKQMSFGDKIGVAFNGPLLCDVSRPALAGWHALLPFFSKALFAFDSITSRC
jgi:hypothetical protein